MGLLTYYWVPPKFVATRRFPLLRMNKSSCINAFRTSPKPIDSLVVTDWLFRHGIWLVLQFFVHQTMQDNKRVLERALEAASKRLRQGTNPNYRCGNCFKKDCQDTECKGPGIEW